MSETTATNALRFLSDRIRAGTSLQRSKKTQIIFYGGEPLLNDRVLRSATLYCESLVATRLLPSPTTLSVVTNGTLLNEDHLRFFKEHNISVGISLDGNSSVNALTRPLRTGGNPDATVCEAISLCKRLNIEVGLSVTITPEGLANEGELISTLLALDVSAISFNILTGMDSALPDDYAERAAAFLISAFESFRDVGVYEDRLLRKVRSFVEGRLYLFDCAAAGGNQIVIGPDGNVGICHALMSTKGYTCGNVNTSVDWSSYDALYQEWATRTPLCMPECVGCPALGICGGGCPFNAFVNCGSIWSLDKRFCTHAQSVLEWLIWDLFKKSLHEGQRFRY